MGRIFLVYFFLSLPAFAATIYVPGDYPAIQEAVDAAAPGDTVFVSSDTYHENVKINKSLHLIGENKDTTLIDGSAAGSVVWIITDGVEVSGFTLQNSGPGWPASVLLLQEPVGM
jgi:nitrous oxidase accessory protein NosD